MFCMGTIPSLLLQDEKALRAKIPYPLTRTNLPGVYTSPAPPHDLDPNKASACELVKNGLLWRRPSTTDVPALRRAWHRVFSRQWQANNRIVPDLCPQPQKTHALRKPLKRAAEANLLSSAWAGALARGGSWTGIAGFWKIPAVTRPAGLQARMDGWRWSSWIGLDGLSAGLASNDMLLAGVEQFLARGDSAPSCVVWFEWYTRPQAGSPPYIYQTNIANFSVSAGQEIFCSVQYIGNSAGYIYFANEATGQHFPLTLAPPPGATLGGNSAEWIAEMTEGGNAAAAPRLAPVLFTSAIACGCSGALGSPQTADRVNIEDAKGKNLTSVAVGDYAATIDFVDQKRPGCAERSDSNTSGSGRWAPSAGRGEGATFCIGRDPRR